MSIVWVKDFQIFDPFSDIVASLLREKSDWYTRISNKIHVYLIFLTFHEVPRETLKYALFQSLLRKQKYLRIFFFSIAFEKI